MKRISLILLLVIFGYAHSLAQNVRATVSADTNNILIGDHVNLTLKFESDKKVNVFFPVVPDTLGGLEILGRSKIDTSISNGNYIFTTKLVATSFDSGIYVVPPFVIMYEKPGITNLYPVQTDTLVIHFSTLAVDTTKDIKDIKPPYGVTIIPWKYIIIAFIVWVILFGIWLTWYLRRKRKRAMEEDLDYDPNIPPHVIALESLRQLDAEKLWQHGQTKQYYIRLTDIVRKYIERRFKMPALEMTSDEIIGGLKSLGFGEVLISKMNKVVVIGDLAKFARYSPYPDENSLVMNYSIDFINATIPDELKDVSNPEAVK